MNSLALPIASVALCIIGMAVGFKAAFDHLNGMPKIFYHWRLLVAHGMGMAGNVGLTMYLYTEITGAAIVCAVTVVAHGHGAYKHWVSWWEEYHRLNPPRRLVLN